MDTDPIKLELMKHVERAVRPVMAAGATKMRMRRELLAHLSTAYEEEVALDDNGPQAMERSVRRLGTPAELTDRLQQSIGRAEVRQARFEARMQRRPGESLVHYALRLAGIWTAFVIVMLLITLGLCFVVGLVVPWETPVDGEKLVRVGYASGILLVVYAVAAILFVFTADLLQRLTGGKLWLLGLGWFAASALFVTVTMTIVFGAIAGAAGTVLGDFGVMFGPGLLLPACIAVGMIAMEITRRRDALWTELSIDV
jgi:hypothetical protein